MNNMSKFQKHWSETRDPISFLRFLVIMVNGSEWENNTSKAYPLMLQKFISGTKRSIMKIMGSVTTRYKKIPCGTECIINWCQSLNAAVNFNRHKTWQIFISHRMLQNFVVGAKRSKNYYHLLNDTYNLSVTKQNVFLSGSKRYLLNKSATDCGGNIFVAKRHQKLKSSFCIVMWREKSATFFLVYYAT